MKYSYKIIYDLNKDIWNWHYGTKYSDNVNQLNGKDFLIAQKIKKMNKRESEKVLRPYLWQKISYKNSKLNSFIKVAEQEFEEKFGDACKALEKITGKPMASNGFTFYVTTFPRMVVFFDESIIFMYAKIDKTLWGMPIDGFLHEGLHFQFEHYWRNDKESLVSKLSEKDYFCLKEALAVILDEELKPIITLPDSSYPELATLREPLHEHWKKHHDFDKLVDYGLTNLKRFIKV